MAEPLRLVICDDHAMVRVGLRRILEDDPAIKVVGEASNAEEAVALTSAESPDVIIMDLGLPGDSGIAATTRIRALNANARVLILTMHEDVAYLREAFAAGACGYVLKAAADTELLEAVREVAAGRRYVHPALGAALLEESGPAEQPVRQVSDREAEILRLLALGYTNPEMAKALHLSVRTVETYRARIQQKLGLRSRADLAAFARDSGLMQ